MLLAPHQVPTEDRDCGSEGERRVEATERGGSTAAETGLDHLVFQSPLHQPISPGYASDDTLASDFVRSDLTLD